MAEYVTLFRPRGPNTLAEAYIGHDVNHRASWDLSDCGSSISPSESASHHGRDAPPLPFVGIPRNKEMLGWRTGKPSHLQAPAHQNNTYSGSVAHISTQVRDFSDSSSGDNNGPIQANTPTTESSESTSDTSQVFQPERQLRRSGKWSENSLRSYDSSFTSTVAPPSPNCGAGEHNIRDSSTSLDRLTEQPVKNRRLFEYIDWDGTPRDTPVKRSPPVSFNRYIQNKTDVAFTNVKFNGNVHGDSATGTYGNKTPDTFKARAGRSGRTLVDASLDASKIKILSDADFKKPKEPERQLRHERRSIERPLTSVLTERPTPELTTTTSPESSTTVPPEPTTTAPPLFFYREHQARVSDHGRSESGSTNDSIPSVTTSKLPNVTRPGMRAYYAQYLAASTLTNSSANSSSIRTSTSRLTNEHRSPSPLRAEFLANHHSTPLSIFPPYANKPLPPLPTPNGPPVAAPEWGVASLAQLEQSAFEIEKLHTNTMELERLMLDPLPTDSSSWMGQSYSDQPDPPAQLGWSIADENSYFSDSDGDEDDADCEVREIDPKMFGRAKYMHMRPGCEGWEEYKEQMLQESKGKRKGKSSGKPKSSKESWIGKRIRAFSFSHSQS